LADFVAPFSLDSKFPQWSISPTGIFFVDAIDASDFLVSFAFGTIAFETDGPSNPPDCGSTGVCVATGHWAVIAEPSGAVLIILGVAALGVVMMTRESSGLKKLKVA